MRTLAVLLAFSLGTVLAQSPKLVVDDQTNFGDRAFVHIRNTYNISATAYMVGIDGKFVEVDSLLGDRDGRPLFPAQQIQIALHGMDPGAEVRLLAAVFEDGTVEGEHQALRHIIDRRQAAANDMVMALGLLNHAIDQKVDRPMAVSWFSQWQERYQRSHVNDTSPVWRTAVKLLSKADGDQTLGDSAREAIQVFKAWSEKLHESKPVLQ
jgi:hypothetical protein